MSEHSHDSHEPHKPPRRRMRIIGRAGMVLGAVQFAVGGAALRVDAAHNMFGDSLAYELKDRASTSHNQLTRPQVRRRLKTAGYVLCISSLFGVAEAAHDVVTDDFHISSSIESGLAAGSMGYGALAAYALHDRRDAAHRHGHRHAVSDVLASGVVLASTITSQRYGLVYADSVGAVTAAAVTLGFNAPTKTRLDESIDDHCSDD